MAVRKSYLSDQIALLTLNGSDLFTDEELALCDRLNDLRTRYEESKDASILDEKKEIQRQLDDLIETHKGIPRFVNPKCVLKASAIAEGKTAISWYDCKLSRRIAEFCSEESRTMGLHAGSITYDKIIVKWKYLNILEQIVKDGFTMNVLRPDGHVETIEFFVHTASAGQLRTSKVQALNVKTYAEHRNTFECGLSDDMINDLGGMNVNKVMAYKALNSSATERWDFNPRNAVVVPDFEAEVTGMMQYIKPDYESERGIRTVKINHCDGCGMGLPGTVNGNFMVRLPWIKGLLTEFDYLKWCDEHHVEPVVTDFWGKIHNLRKENITVIFTVSQFKLAKYYASWEEYCDKFEQYNCHCCATNFEEDRIPDTEFNYQRGSFIQ